MKRLFVVLLFACGAPYIPLPDAGAGPPVQGLCSCDDVGQRATGEDGETVQCTHVCNSSETITFDDGGTVQTYCLVACVGFRCCQWRLLDGGGM